METDYVYSIPEKIVKGWIDIKDVTNFTGKSPEITNRIQEKVKTYSNKTNKNTTLKSKYFTDLELHTFNLLTRRSRENDAANLGNIITTEI